MPMRPRVLALAIALLSATLVGCAGSGGSPQPWTLYSVGPLPTLPPTPAPSPTDEPVAEATPPPPDCPSPMPAQPLRLHELDRIDPACFGTASITLVGWQGRPGDAGFEGPHVEPGWLIYPQDQARSGFWDAKPDGSGGCGSNPICEWTFLHVAPGSSIMFNARGRWVQVTGHLNDPAAATCHYVYGPDPSQTELLPDSDAQHWCASSFVLEQVEVTTAP